MPLKIVRWKCFLLVGVSSVILISDQWTKWIIYSTMQVGQSIPVIPGFFSITYVRNKGAAFGFLHDAPSYFRDPFFVAVPIVALLAIFFLFAKTNERQKLNALCLTLVIGGAIGNLIDRVRFGYVVDFLDFFINEHHWPAFNVADSSIVVGVCVLFVLSFFESTQVENNSAP